MEAAPSRTRTLPIALALLAVGLFSLLAGSAAQAGGGVSPGDKHSGGSGGGKLIGVSPSYAKFSDLVSDKTRLSLRVLGAWSLAEGGPKDNPLNIGPGHRYGTIGKGARATAQLLRMPRYRAIRRSTRGSDGQQIKAIANSRWCPGCRGYGRLLRSTYSRVKVR